MDNITRHIGFGCVSLTQQPFEHAALDLLLAAFDQGITHFDTAPLYGNGYSEKILGKFIKNRRQALTVTTKFGLGNLRQPGLPASLALPLHALRRRVRKGAAGPPAASPPPAGRQALSAQPAPAPLEFRSIDVRYIQESLAGSLRNLQTDYIDLYLLHEALPSFLNSGALGFLKEQKNKGVIRQLGVAAGYVNLLPLEPEDLAGWDILQYEHGIGYPTDGILQRFKDQQHIYHSSLRSLGSFPDHRYSREELAGILLNRGIRRNPQGKILFATTRKERIKANMDAYRKYNSYSQQELDSLIDALY